MILNFFRDGIKAEFGKASFPIVNMEKLINIISLDMQKEN